MECGWATTDRSPPRDSGLIAANNDTLLNQGEQEMADSFRYGKRITVLVGIAAMGVAVTAGPAQAAGGTTGRSIGR